MVTRAKKKRTENNMPTTQEPMLRAWCEYRNQEYSEGNVCPLPSDNFKHGYLMGRRDAVASQWISVKDELPKIDDDVLAIFSRSYTPAYKEMAIAYYDGEDWYTSDGSHIRPTHWLPIPQPPKSKNK